MAATITMTAAICSKTTNVNQDEQRQPREARQPVVVEQVDSHASVILRYAFLMRPPFKCFSSHWFQHQQRQQEQVRN
jgi:hypothetical protein